MEGCYILEFIYLMMKPFLFWLIAAWFYQQHEHVKFNYKDSFWEHLDKKLKRAWFKNNSRPDWEKKYWMFPFIWDGYHFFSWMMKLFYWLTYPFVIDASLSIWLITGVVFAVTESLQNQVTYDWTFK